jgi:hypothetical protein
MPQKLNKPFIIVLKAVSAISAVALSLNCKSHLLSKNHYQLFTHTHQPGISNFFVGLVFLPLRSLLSGNDPLKEGRVFYVFAGVLAVGMVSLLRVYRG